MGLRAELQKRIEKKEVEVYEYEQRILEARAYIQGLQDTLKLIPKEEDGEIQDANLRHGSNIAKARDALRAAAKPLHITELLKAIGEPTDKKHRLGLAGSIAAYVRKGLVFKRTEPNTFGLIEFDRPNEDQVEKDLVGVNLREFATK